MNESNKTETLKVLLSKKQDEALRKKCNSIGAQRGPTVRRLINEFTSAHIIRRPARREWPSQGHIPNFPSRAAFGGAAIPMRV
jgi:hypothetical protein